MILSHQRDSTEADPQLCRLLLAEDERLAGLRSRQYSQHFGDQWAQVQECVCARHHHDDRETKCRQVLLVLELAVNSEEGVELLLGEAQQFPVAFAGPSHLWSGACHVANQVAL